MPMCILTIILQCVCGGGGIRNFLVKSHALYNTKVLLRQKSPFKEQYLVFAPDQSVYAEMHHEMV